MKKKLVILSSSILSFMPMLALAAGPTDVQGFLGVIMNILSVVIPLVIILGVVYFVWGVVQYVISSDEEAKKAGKNRMIYGIIGLVVIVGLWGLVGMVTKSFGLDNSVAPAIDLLPQ